jgi:hypothetical protein
LYSIIDLNIRQPASPILLARQRFCCMFWTAKSSTQKLVQSWFSTRLVVNLCRKSCLVFATFRCALFSLPFCRSYALVPSFLLLRSCCSCLIVSSCFPRCRGLSILVPSDKVARVVSPRSMPTVLSDSMGCWATTTSAVL